MEYAFIDPLKLAIRRIIPYSTYPLSSRASFGSEEDIKEIAVSVKRLLNSKKTPLLWMSPILEPSRARRLSNIPEATEIACVVDESRLKEPMKSAWQSLKEMPLFFYDSKGILRAGNSQAEKAKWNDLASRNIRILRKNWVDSILKPLLENARRHLPSGEPIELPSKRFVSEWIDMKPVLQDPDDAFSIAYELGFVLSNGYQDEMRELDAFACSNNTGLILSSHLSLIFAKELLIIDRAGPLPKLPTRVFPDIAGLNICLVEETIATGREVDLASLFIRMKGATLTKILAVCKIGPTLPVVAQAQAVSMEFLYWFPDTTVAEKQPPSGSDMRGVSNLGV